MKKHQSPSTTQNPESLYAQVNKRGRGKHPQPTEDIIYAEVNSGGRGQNQRHPDEVLYAEVSSGGRRQNQRRSDEVLYAEVNSGGRRQNQRHPDEVLYAEVNSGGRRQNQRHPDEVLYAEVNSGGRGQRPHRPGETDYTEVNPRGREQHHHRHAGDTDYTQVNPRQRGAARLSEEEIAKKTGEDVHVKAYQEEVQHWSKIVYGKSGVLNEKLRDIVKNPQLGEQVSWDVAADPKSVHKLAGYALGRLKTSARKEAEEGLQHLCNALDGLTGAAKEARQRLQHVPKAEERHQQCLQKGERTQHREHAQHRGQERQQNAPEVTPRRGVRSQSPAFAM